MKNPSKLISICIPTYSRLHYLQQAVASALSQNYNNTEICISQDPMQNGADTTLNKWCVELAKNERNIIYNLNNNNLGLAGNWNKLVEIASGEFVIIIGDDDLLKENFLSSVVDLINKTNADVGFSNQAFIDESGNVLEDKTKHLNKIYQRDDIQPGLLNDPIQSVINNSVPMSAALIRRSLLLENRFDEEMNTPELPVFLQLAVNNKRFCYINRQLAYYRVHQNSETSAGLTIDRLLKNIINIQVPDAYIEMKKKFISSKIIPGINKSLRSGNKPLAKFLLNSAYYPSNEMLKKFVQRMMLLLPVGISKILL